MKLRKILALLVAMVMTLGCVGITAMAEETAVTTIKTTDYDDFAAAMTAANNASGAVEVEINGAVEFVNGMELKGNYTSITFVGKSDGAKVTINQSAGGDYLEAHGKTVAFTDLTLAKANPAWSGNSGHMGNYFSVQGGNVTYTNCIFPNGACTSTGTAIYNDCTFQNTSEYGLWVYDDANVTVNGGTIDSKKGIKVYSEGEDSVTSTLTVENATFTDNVTEKPAVAIGYAESITLIGNTYNNTTGVLELDSGTDADCEGVTFVAQDANGNDIASTLTAVDRSNSNAACGVLVDGKIYTTVTEAAKEVKTGDTVTLLFDSTETVELPEGVTLNSNSYTAENVTVKVATPVEVATYEELVAALAKGGNIILTADITTAAALTTSGITATIDLNGKTLNVRAGDNKFNDASNITIKNGTINIDGVIVNGNAIFCLDEYEETLVTTLTLENVDLEGKDYSSAYGVFYIGDSSVLNVNGGNWVLSNDTHASGGVFKADDAKATVNISNVTMDLHNVRRVVTYADTTIENSTLTIYGDADEVDAEMEHGFNRSPLAVANSTITMTDMVGRGITAQCGAVSISDNSSVTMINCQEATIDVRSAQTVTVSEDSTVKVDKEPTLTSGKISGTVTVQVTPKGTLPAAYTKEVDGYVRVWGESYELNAKESVKYELYSGTTLMATTQLNNIGNIIDGDIPELTWNFFYPESADAYWTTTWTEGHPNAAAQPTKVILYVDGTNVAEASVQMNGPDNLNPVIWKELGGVRTIKLPTATVTELDNSELTFAMTFAADDVTEEQLAYYGDWYADFELTVNKEVTFNANGNADGYLSGQYDGWSENWVNVPFEDVTITADSPLKIMEYAAELMGQPGLKYTYGEVYEFVKEFNCGVFFTEEFLKANPDLEVTLELRMYNPEDETESYVIGETYAFEAPEVEEEEPYIFGKAFYMVDLPVINDRYQVGLYAGIDSLKYKEVGFKIYNQNDMIIGQNSTNTVYTSVKGSNMTVTAEMIESFRIFGATAEFGKAWDNIAVFFRPYAIDLNGKEILGYKYKIADIYTTTTATE